VTGLLNLIQSRLQIRVPRVELFVGKLLALIDGDNACKPVDFGADSTINDHVAKLVLCALDGDTDELAHTFKAHTAVVLLNDA